MVKSYFTANGGEAVLQNLKIWQDRQYPYHHSLSFFASTRELRHLDFPLLDFQRDVKPEPKQPNVAHINFVKRRQSYSSSDPKARRTSTLFRTPSLPFHGKSPPKGNPSKDLTLNSSRHLNTEISSSQKKRTSVSSASSSHPHGDIPAEFGFFGHHEEAYLIFLQPSARTS